METKENQNIEVVKEQVVQSSLEKTQVLLGAISYINQDDYEKFLENLDINQAVFVLMAGCNYAQSKGSYNLDESELISKAIKTLKKSSKEPKETSDQ
jgi:hypothetical protein